MRLFNRSKPAQPDDALHQIMRSVDNILVKPLGFAPLDSIEQKVDSVRQMIDEKIPLPKPVMVKNMVDQMVDSVTGMLPEPEPPADTRSFFQKLPVVGQPPPEPASLLEKFKPPFMK